MPECPVCGRNIPARRLNAHVNRCLDGRQNDPAGEGRPPPVTEQDRRILPDVRIDKRRPLPSSLASRFGVHPSRGGILYLHLTRVTGEFFGSDAAAPKSYYVTVSVEGFSTASPRVRASRGGKGSAGLALHFECACPIQSFFAESPVSVSLFEVPTVGHALKLATAVFPLRACMSTHAVAESVPPLRQQAPQERPTNAASADESRIGRRLQLLQRGWRIRNAVMTTRDGLDDSDDDDIVVEALQARAGERGAVPASLQHGRLRPVGPLSGSLQARPEGSWCFEVDRPVEGFLGSRAFSRRVLVSVQEEPSAVLRACTTVCRFLHLPWAFPSSSKDCTHDERVTFHFEGVYICNSDIPSVMSTDADLFAAHRAAADDNVHLLAEIFRSRGSDYAVFRTRPLENSMMYGKDGSQVRFGALTPLDVACLCGNLRVVNYLLRALPVSARLSTGSGMHPLHYAVLSGREDVVRALVEHMRAPRRVASVPGAEGGPHHDAAEHREESRVVIDATLRAWASRHAQIVDSLFRHPPDTPAAWKMLFTPLPLPTELYADAGRIPVPLAREQSTVLRSQPLGTSDLDVVDACGNSALSLAAALGQMGVVACLLQARASRGVVSASGNTPLTLALSNGFIQVAAVLLLGDTAVPLPRVTAHVPATSTTCKCRTSGSPVEVLSRTSSIQLTGPSWQVSHDAAALHTIIAPCNPSAMNKAGHSALSLATRLAGTAATETARTAAHNLLQLLIDVGCPRTPASSVCQAEVPLCIAAQNGDFASVASLCLMEDDTLRNAIRKYAADGITTQDVYSAAAQLGWLPLAAGAVTSVGDDGRGKLFSRFCEPVRVHVEDANHVTPLQGSKRAGAHAAEVADLLSALLVAETRLKGLHTPTQVDSADLGDVDVYELPSAVGATPQGLEESPDDVLDI